MFYLFPRIIKPEVCNKIVKDFIAEDLKPATVSVALRDDPTVRKTSVYFIPTKLSSKANEIAWHFLKEANKQMFDYDLTYFQSVQFSEYSVGGFYDWHIDVASKNKPNKTRKLSLSLMLTDPDTFDGKQVKNDLKAQGTIVVFDSRDFHRVTPMVDGTRHSIVCWATGSPFR